jgi:modification methylase
MSHHHDHPSLPAQTHPSQGHDPSGQPGAHSEARREQSRGWSSSGLRDTSAFWELDPAHQATSVWLAAMRDAKAQRRGRYLPQSAAHPAKMLPDLARHAIAHYTRPGELVLDPMCGIGTTLVEAVRTGRHAIGVEYEPRWAAIARGNIVLARQDGATGRAWVRTADARGLPDLLRPGPPIHPSHGSSRSGARPVALIVTSPPYGAHTHGHGRTRPGHVIKTHYQYSPTRRGSANLAHRDLAQLLAGFTHILTGAVALLRPGGHVVLTARPYRRNGQLVDLPGALADAAEAAGLTQVERAIAPLAGLRDGHLVTRASFFQRLAVRNARATGTPQQIPLHEDILIFRLVPTLDVQPGTAGLDPSVVPTRFGPGGGVDREGSTWERWEGNAA